MSISITESIVEVADTSNQLDLVDGSTTVITVDENNAVIETTTTQTSLTINPPAEASVNVTSSNTVLTVSTLFNYRREITVNLGTVAPYATVLQPVDICSTFVLLRVEASTPENRCRLYMNENAAIADQPRPVGVRPGANSGLIAETVNVADLWLPRPAVGVLHVGTQTAQLQISNLTGTPTPMTVTLTIVTLEA